MTVLTESFNKADSTTLGPDLTWTEVSGNLEVVSNRCRAASLGSGSAGRAEHDLASADHYAQVVVHALTGGDNVNVRVLGRFSASALTWYEAVVDGDTVFLRKSIAGSISGVTGDKNLTLPSLPFTLRIECEGSTIRALINGVVELSGTDTSITGNTRTGIRLFNNSSGLNDLLVDSFEAGDLGTNGTATPAAIAVTSTIPAPTSTGGATSTPAVTALSAALPASSAGASVNATPTAVAATTTTPAASATGAGSATPAAVTAPASLPTPSPSGGGSAATTPDAIAVTVAAPAASATGAATTIPAAVTTPIALPAPTAAGASTASPAATTTTSTLPAATATGAGSATPTAVTPSLTIPAAVAGGSGTASPGLIARVFALPAATAGSGSTITPTTIAVAVILHLVSASGVFTRVLIPPFGGRLRHSGATAGRLRTDGVTAARLRTTKTKGRLREH